MTLMCEHRGLVLFLFCTFASHFNSYVCHEDQTSNFTLWVSQQQNSLWFLMLLLCPFLQRVRNTLLVLTSPLTLVLSLPRLKYPDNLHIRVLQWYHVPMSLHMGSSSSWGQGEFNLKHLHMARNHFRTLFSFYCADRGFHFMEKLHKAWDSGSECARCIELQQENNPGMLFFGVKELKCS